ncbi:MAG: hypothetical protein Q9219_000304 [cf. Caloplaca sp. 3 TL-2023]
MVSTEEGIHVCPDGTELYTKTWKPSSSALARIVFVHGFSDHCNAYHELFPTLASRRIVVHGFDQRGWGRSVKKHYAANGPRDIKSQLSGYICESPLIAIHEDTQPSKFIVLAGRLASKIVPHRQMVRQIEPKLLCRDEELYKKFEADELCHDTGTLEGLAAMLQRAEDLHTGRLPTEDLRGCSLWVGHGTEDRVTSFKATARFIESIPVKDKTFKIYDGHYHKLHAEPGEDRRKFANDVADWVLARSSPADNTTGTLPEAKSRL